MRKLSGMRIALFGILLVGLFAALSMAVVPAQASLPAGSTAQEITVVPPEVNPTVVVNQTVVVPATGDDAGTATTNWFIPVLIIIGVALVVLFAVALAGRGSRTDV